MDEDRNDLPEVDLSLVDTEALFCEIARRYDACLLLAYGLQPPERGDKFLYRWHGSPIIQIGMMERHKVELIDGLMDAPVNPDR